jgi:CTP-dependent riboflavin kinase
MLLNGTFRLNDENMHRFGSFLAANSQLFESYLGVRLFNGSLNVHVPFPRSLADDLDAGKLSPSIVIPKAKMIGNVLGDGHAWTSMLRSSKLPGLIKCWVFRRIGSRVDRGIIEILAVDELVEPYKLVQGDPVNIELLQCD